MIDIFDCPDFDKTELFRPNKVINEPGFLLLHFVPCNRNCGAGPPPSRFVFSLAQTWTKPRIEAL
jgi:hypothetical protein